MPVCAVGFGRLSYRESLSGPHLRMKKSKAASPSWYHSPRASWGQKVPEVNSQSSAIQLGWGVAGCGVVLG